MLGYYQAFSGRRPDPRVAATIASKLSTPSNRQLLDLGAGTGGYATLLASHGYSVALADRSAMQITKAPNHFLRVVAEASNLPFNSKTFDGCYVILALHQFKFLKKSISEIARVTGRKNFCAMTFDRTEGADSWIADYFPEAWYNSYSKLPQIREQANLISECFGEKASIEPFPIPRNFNDTWLAAGWDSPARYLSDSYRAQNSSFHQIKQSVIEKCVSRLSADLKSGAWTEKYGKLINTENHSAGYFVINI